MRPEGGSCRPAHPEQEDQRLRREGGLQLGGVRSQPTGSDTPNGVLLGSDRALRASESPSQMGCGKRTPGWRGGGGVGKLHLMREAGPGPRVSERGAVGPAPWRP